MALNPHSRGWSDECGVTPPRRRSGWREGWPAVGRRLAGGRRGVPDVALRDRPLRQGVPDLALDALERVVDRLAIAPDPPAHLLVGVTVEIERQHARLELGTGGGAARYQRPELVGADHLIDGVVDRRAGDDLIQGGLALGAGRGRARKRH